MIFDIKMKGNQFLMTVHRKFFEHENLANFLAGNLLTEKYSYCGKFIAIDKEFGFDGCMKQTHEDETYRYFAFDFPAQTIVEKRQKNLLCVDSKNIDSFRQFLVTIHLMHHYIVETMDYEKILHDTDAWNDQSFSFQMFFESGTNGKAIGGYVYEWQKNKLASLETEGLAQLRDYVHSELKRFYFYFEGQDISYEQVSFSNEGWLIVVNMNGRWISWKASSGKKNDFSSHNIDFSCDQASCFAAVVAINTWLREN